MYFGVHNHSHYSNLRLKDCTNTPKQVIDTAIKKGLKGIALTDHEIVSGHYSFWSYYNQLKKEDKLPRGFKIALGNEIYLIDKEKEKEAMENKEKFHYDHFILIAKNDHGLLGLRKLSSQAWKNEHYYRGMQRVPTYYDELKEIMKEYKGDIIASSSCLGSPLSKLLLQYNQEKTQENWLKIHNFVKYLIDIFGKENIYFESQPSHHEEQKIVNSMLKILSKHYGILNIVSTDAHYAEKKNFPSHRTFLESQDGEREAEYFYATTYIMSHDELLEFFEEDDLKTLEENTNDVYNKIEEYHLDHQTIIPKSVIPTPFHLDKDKLNNKYKDYQYIIEMINSQYIEDNYYISLVLNGINNRPDVEETDEVLSRIDLECSELVGLTEQLKQPMSSYFLLMKDFIDIMWEVSLVGPARGSASCWLTNYLIGITEVNSLTFNLPHWRFLTKERVGSFPKQ